ncbi:hypothetical protein NW762_000302 [Fusarium torreyae]|uniref:Uncharacterized protein n=1 Tax=Fusarium torreyae TaxID=1237075 RepID=A0A9W8SHM2_9HYPO|nr:hypothetical protein NW762_000302 [Fusarium torreyae]
MAKKKANKKGTDPKPGDPPKQKLNKSKTKKRTGPKPEDLPKQATDKPKNKQNNRRRRNQHKKSAQNKMSPINPPRETGTKCYGSKLARERLETEGFHPDVTDKTLPEIQQEFEDTWKSSQHKPSRNDFLNGKFPHFEGHYTNSYYFFEHLKLSEYDVSKLPCPILGLFAGWEPYGLLIGEKIAMQGIRQLEAINIAFPKAWGALSQGMAVWDFAIQGFHKLPYGPVFMCLEPERSQGQFETSKDTASLRKMENAARDNVLKLVTYVHDHCRPTAPYWGEHERARGQTMGDSPQVTVDSIRYGRRLIKMICSLPHIEGLKQKIEELVDPEPEQDYYMSKQVALNSTVKLLHTIHNRSHLVRVLHFHKTPLLDRRLVAIILRSCSLVKMIGIYECPQLHFGDIIPLLDLIHEVNMNRSEQKRPKVEALDFYPRYHAGMPYRGTGTQVSEAYGLTWKAMNNDVVQRGVLAIVMQAVLKSRRMKLDVLMDKNAAFMTYLSNLPMLPGKAHGFLDGLFRYLDLVAAKSNDKNAIKKATYDMVKAIKLGIENVEKDWPKYYIGKMATDLVFCSSCGYEMLPEFYSNREIGNRPHARTCAGCILRFWLDEEEDHQKKEALDVMTPFFPDWDPTSFNNDARLLPEARGLIRMGSRKAERSPTPSMQVRPDGSFYQPQYTIELVRDNKAHGDSVQGLPSLVGLLKSDGQRAKDVAMVADAERIVALLLRDFYPVRTGALEAFAAHREDRGAPDHYDESQGDAQHLQKMPHKLSPNFTTAMKQFNSLNEAGH